ncbi:hypothetical protein J1N35_007846 [Gossypium stocksii]|uniref:Uncharacterized protein n=1 Tax=Gossypium stocksii TaxID=47602 RepID=A0A9D3W9A4_9ROSI|nr:hypothetical protein J1N35_007846 [Gossypium stocksii]
MTLYWEYVKKHDVALKKALQNNFIKPMLLFPLFPKELLFDDVEEDDEPTTTHKHTKEPAKDEELTESVHLNSDREDEN